MSPQRRSERLSALARCHIESVLWGQDRPVFNTLCSQLCPATYGLLPHGQFWWLRGKLYFDLRQLPAYCSQSVAMSWRLW